MNEKDVIDLFSYIASSARGCIDEPHIYGSFRLVDVMSKLFYLLKRNSLISIPEMAKMIEKIDEKKYSCMSDKEEFVNMLDEVIDELVDLDQQP